jgi:hypothetical protein
MNGFRRNALAAGVLLIIGTVASAVLANIVMGSSLRDPLDLARIAGDPTPVLLGALLHLVGAAACPGIVLALYPALRAVSPTLALGSVAFRIIEATFYVIGVVGLLVLVSLGREAVATGASDASFFAHAGSMLLATRSWLGFVAGATFAAVGTLLYDLALYRSALVPRWLAGWGIVATVAMLVAVVLALFGIAAPLSTIHIGLNLPIAVQEMVLAGWLIARGFNTRALLATPVSATASGSATTPGSATAPSGVGAAA